MLISIIMPVYNSEKYLSRSIESVLNQKFKSFEFIIVNDGSTDSSYNICKKYLKKDSRIKLINCNNNGVSAARNIGINNAKGKYIVFCDSDDMVEENWCNKLFYYAEKYEEDFVMCGISRNHLVGNISKNILFDEGNDISILEKKEFYSVYSKWLFNFPINKIYSTNILLHNNIRFDEKISLGEDLIFNLEYLKFVGSRIVIINKPLYKYIFENNYSLSNKYYDDFFDIQRLLYRKIYDEMILLNSDIKKYEKDYYTNYLIDIIWTLNNTFKEQNKISFYQKLLINREILSSDELKISLNKFNRKKIGRIHMWILKTKNPLLEYIYQNIRSKIKK